MTAVARALRRARKRGFSLVEVALALAVLGIILSGLIIPIGNELRRKSFVATHAGIENAIEAVVGFAATNRSTSLFVGYGGLSNLPAHANSIATADTLNTHAVLGLQYLRIPAGRPVLPCPDINNDGHEDRYGRDLPVNGTGPADIVAPAPSAASAQDLRPLYFHRAIAISNINFPVGECRQSSGNLPWKTLGLPAADAWGNLYTYIVHPNFAASAIGFDEHTRASSFPLYSQPDGVANNYESMAGRGDDGRSALLVCDAFAETITNCTNAIPGATAAARAAAFETAAASPAANRIQYFAAPVLISEDNLYPLARAGFISQIGGVTHGLVTDGLPFAIISHGANAKGARRANGTGCANVDFTAGSLEDREGSNALYGTCEADVSAVYGAGDPRGFHDFAAATPAGRDFSNKYIFDDVFENYAEYIEIYDNYGAIFAAQRGGHAKPGRSLSSSVGTPPPATGGTSTEFDDIVGWLTRRELADRMHEAGVFPVENYAGMLVEGLPADLTGLQ